LLVLPRHTGPLEHTTFGHLPDYLRAGDLLVLNDTRVFPARLLGRREPSGGAVECLLLQKHRDPGSGTGDPVVPPPESRISTSEPPVPSSESRLVEDWDALMHPGQKLKPGARVVFERNGSRLEGEVVGRHFYGRRTIRLRAEEGTTIAEVIDRIGHIPLPPYIHRADEASDRERYQTVFARETGSIAAPTAGLHFTPPLLQEIRTRGVELATITLHVGYGTFKPVRVERVDEHEVDPEVYTVSAATADAVTRALREHRRIIAVGTTTTRALESLPIRDDRAVLPLTGETRLFIHPGHHFRIVQGLVTNFHLPRSSLLMLVAAFAGRERLLAAYRDAVERRYRFYSYGDAMAIL
jgi:S-adenosylmethionine:tRNA ribosyltransferase-isomerase